MAWVAREYFFGRAGDVTTRERMRNADELRTEYLKGKGRAQKNEANLV